MIGVAEVEALNPLEAQRITANDELRRPDIGEGCAQPFPHPAGHCERARMPLSVITDVAAQLAAEHPIRPAGIHEDDWQQRHRANEEEGLCAWWRGGLPDRVVTRYDHRPQTDRNTKIRHQEQGDREKEWRG